MFLIFMPVVQVRSSGGEFCFVFFANSLVVAKKWVLASIVYPFLRKLFQVVQIYFRNRKVYLPLLNLSTTWINSLDNLSCHYASNFRIVATAVKIFLNFELDNAIFKHQEVDEVKHNQVHIICTRTSTTIFTK